MRVIWPVLFVLTALLAGAAPGRAQPVPDPMPPVTSTEAFTGEYGARLVDEFAAILAASADQACLAARGLAPPSRDRAVDWLVRYGQRVVELADAYDRRSALAAFVAVAGDGAPAELDALSRLPQVREMLTLVARMRQDGAAELIAGALDDHLAQANARLARRLRLVALGTELGSLRHTHSEAGMEALGRHLSERPNLPELRRFLELLADWGSATADAMDAAKAAASRGFDGIVEELRASCIASQPQ